MNFFICTALGVQSHYTSHMIIQVVKQYTLIHIHNAHVCVCVCPYEHVCMDIKNMCVNSFIDSLACFLTDFLFKFLIFYYSYHHHMVYVCACVYVLPLDEFFHLYSSWCAVTLHLPYDYPG